MKKLVVYTCVTNDYDWLVPPIWISPDVKYICFTDNPLLSCRGWEIRVLPQMVESTSAVLANRFCKFFPWKILPQHKWSLYVDANIRLMSDPSLIISDAEAIGVELAMPNHPQRSDIWEEASACELLGKFTNSDLAILDAQLARYESTGMPRDFGLTANGIIFRSGQSTRLLPVMEKWWSEFLEGVKRDQISLPFVLWSTGVPIYRIPFFVWNANPYFRIVPHCRDHGWFGYLSSRRYHSKVWFVAYKFINVLWFMRRLVARFFS